MAPNGVLKREYPSDVVNAFTESDDVKIVHLSRRQPLKWLNIIVISLVHILGVYGLFVIPTAKFSSILFALIYGLASGFGVTGGVHRLWAHRSYQANLPLRIILAICYSMTGQNSIPQWVQDHRVHHKFSESDADPHNSNRGFFFAHVGWLFQKKHPDVLSKGKYIDMSDIYADPVVRFHTKYFMIIKLLFSMVIPMSIPYYLWNETFNVIFYGNAFRLICGLNATWLVNSAAHIYGYRPFSSQIRPAENKMVSFVTLGEGWHNYHHVFPWDYKAAEFGGFFNVNPTSQIIDAFASIGWATNLKSPSQDLIQKIAKKHGDGSYKAQHVPEVDENGMELHCTEEISKES